ncbi:proteasome regulatory particle base subunit rpn10 [Coemansia sp. RSA 1813]|nr:proteasome regulatory particle base subunit rpn10 [Coemansia sp. RSA 1646]KAJ1772141.1 proteasome regulatory particle base subunit rpn10 [Coemansia sp. RSA 1843]KAJ2091740.1 proteasome regulatory particle base subunit rpn10 [Coemansia sp. RSA 986]KAJ2216856.1 proteasome regulatory particle base subunit rpn10 [Coemansia sp. RSA 487]KAJ2571858.1 proteasome regulatory particle base subunit rpn10 [Coemansia sp. RSA 1813]
MVLEATVLIIDNSEWARNGDYTPSRYQAQIDSVHYLFSIKTNDNPENTVGVIANAGDSPEVLVSLTNDLGVLLKGLHGLGVRGGSHFDTSIQIAQLVLKHRANKYQKQRIIIFAASPIGADEKTLVKLGKKLKKNGVSIDVVNFGEHTANEQKLTAFVDAANNNDTSNMVTIPPGPHVLSEQIRASPIVGERFGGQEGGGGDNDFGFDVDPDIDPELAMALRMSMQEEEERQRRETAAQQASSSESNKDGQPEHGGAGGSADDGMEMDLDEDEQIRRAIQMSLMESGQDNGGEGNGGGASGSSAKGDELVASLIGSLPGVDPNDPALQDALGSDSTSKNKDDSKGKDKGGDKDGSN